jgi:uncharacterized protein (DUF1015 family)
VPPFQPFAGLRYDPDAVALGDVVAPPYDVIGEAERRRLEDRSPYNAVRLELPRDDGDTDRYSAAACLLADWQAKGVLVRDEAPAFYVYRMGYHDEQGRPRQTAGVVGALALSPPGQGDVLPHERTMPKPKGDRLDLLRACRANLSPVWVLSTADGLSALCEQPGPPAARATDDLGVHHRLWAVTQPGVVEALRAAVSSAPVVIADGHHRYETALAYREEQGGTPGPWDSVMAFAVELAEEQLTVRPIHRLLSGLPDGFDLLDALSPWFEAFELAPPGAPFGPSMADAGALGCVLPHGRWLLRPRPGAFPEDVTLDSERLDVARAGLPPHEVAYQHGEDTVAGVVAAGRAQAGVLLRPAGVAEIAAVARARTRMPEKTTFFSPKPATGMVFRPLD